MTSQQAKRATWCANDRFSKEVGRLAFQQSHGLVGRNENSPRLGGAHHTTRRLEAADV